MFSMVSGMIGLMAAICIMVLIRKDHLHVRYGLWWVIVAIGFVVLGFFPGIFDWLGRVLGVKYGPALAFTLGLTIFALKLLTVDIARSRNDTRIVRMVQRIAILEAEVRQLKGSKPTAGNVPASNEPKSREQDVGR